MVVCKYYLQGNCHFGERCRFEHPRQQGFGQNQGFSGGQSGKFQNSFGGGNNRFAPLNNAGGGDGNRASGQQTIKDMSPQDIINVICQEMKVWESSNMWPFSCFTYAKDGVCMAGFDDLSPEELRAEAYQMQKDNNFQTYQNKVQQLVNEYRMKRQVLRAPQPDIKQKLLQEIQAHKASAAKPAGQSGAFGTKTVSGGFGSTTAAPQGLFGKPAQPTPGLFGSNPATQNQFGQQQPQQPVQGLFGKSQTSQNLFGKSQPSQNLFGKSQTAPTPFGQAQTGQSTFGQAQTGQSTFGGSAMFGGAPAPPVSQGSVFGGSAQTQGSVFGAPATAPTQPTGTFGAMPAPTPGLFGGQNNPAPTGLFGKPAAQPAGSGMFGNTQTAAQPATQPTSLFGKGAPAPAPTGLFGKPATGSVFGGNPAQSLGGAPTSQPQLGQATPQASSIYTPLADLTDEEKAQFTAAKFVLGKIPTRPPPREMVS